MVKLLLENNASCLIKNKDKMNPVHACIYSDKVKVFEAILIETESELQSLEGGSAQKAIDLTTVNG